MGLYARLVLPRLIDLSMRNRRLAPLRAQIAAGAHGRVLEIGIGSGLNLPYYGRDLEVVVGIDPSAELLARARRKAAWMHFPVRLLETGAAAIPEDDASFDVAIVTWSLCSIAEPARALAEVRRLLRPGGELLFVEHGRAESERIARWQDRLTPLWRRFAGGCHLNRAMDELITSAGFRITELETGHLIPGPRLFTFHYKGRAVTA